MGWKLVNGNFQFPITQSRTFGASDIGHANAMSNSHFHVRLEGERLFLRDLGSEHGTFFDNRKLRLHDQVELEPGQVFQASNLDFAVQHVPDPNQTLFALPFILLPPFVVFLNSALDFGASLSFGSIAIVVLSSMIAFAGAVAFWQWALFQQLKLSWKIPSILLCGLLIVPTGAVADYTLKKLLDRQIGFSRQVAAEEIEHFCVDSFDRTQCVKAINLCPSCSKEIPPEQRAIVAQSLKAARYYYPASMKTSR